MKVKSLRTKAYRSLRLDIVSGSIRGGTRLTENEIADSLNVSRTSVREARVIRPFGKSPEESPVRCLQPGRVNIPDPECDCRIRDDDRVMI